jgi:hypothetical protein
LKNLEEDETLLVQSGKPVAVFKSHNMKYSIQKNQMLWLVASSLLLLAGCSRGAEATPQATPTLAPPPPGFTYCDIDPAKICLEGFGQDVEERLLVLFTIADEIYTNIYIRADGPEGEMLFRCQQSERFPENIYCLGEPFPEGELIKLNVYSKRDNDFLAIGVFNVEYVELPESDIVFYEDVTPGSSYPNPSYPNPSYPNPNPTP